MRTLLVVLALLLAAATSAAAQDTANASALELQPGDLLRVTIWREEDLSGDFMVDQDGTVTLPLLGKQRAVGIPFPALRDTLLSRYETQLRNPSITVIPLRRINVLGEVQRPGMYPVDPTVSLAGALALAGGSTPQGDLRKIRILRDGEVIRQRVGTGETLSSAGIRSGDEIIVDRRNWFDRNSTFVVSAVLSLTSIVIALTR